MGEVVRDERKSDLSPGALFADRYQIEAILGRGGMGSVYRACDLSLGESIALKLLAFGPEPPPVAVLRFRQEVKLARRVTHPNVARVYDIGEHDGQIFLTMELISGGTLRALLERERRLSLRRTLAIARALTEGLAAAHRAGVIHRDLKPTNVLLDHDGRVVLTDFGIARSLQEELTLTQGVIGTPHYMAPEQAYGGHVDARADVYALGRMLYEMVTGERAAIEPERLTEALSRQGASAAFVALTLSCLAVDPAARPSSAAEVAHALAEICADEAGAPITDVRSASRPDAPSAPSAPGAPGAPDAMTQQSPSFCPDAAAGGMRSLAVLPFLYRGSKETDYFGDALTDELVDVLSRTRSLRVLGTAATARYRQERDPRVVGRELSVFGVIDGVVQIMGTRVRISVRLAGTRTGAQLWSGHHEGSIEDIFAFQEAIARQIAEELRVEITALTHLGNAPAIAIEHYLSARRKLRNFDYAGATAAVEGFAHCIELAPTFAPAFAGHAIGSVRAWFFQDDPSQGQDWEQEAAASVARALERAPELAETHLAAGIHATQYGNYPEAVRALSQTLVIAPTCAEAHEHLGMIECEAGRWESGARRLKLASDLDPAPYPLTLLARTYALHGHDRACDELLTRLEQRGGVTERLAVMTRLRVLAWRGDLTTARNIIESRRLDEGEMLYVVAKLYMRILLGESDEQEAGRYYANLSAKVSNRRKLTHASQLVTEMLTGRGNLELGSAYLVHTANLVLLDLDWLDRCPILAPLRPLPAFAEARRIVRARVEAITHL